MTQFVVVDEILVSECEAEDALTDKGAHVVLDEVRPPLVAKAGGETLWRPDRPSRRAERPHPT